DGTHFSSVFPEYQPIVNAAGTTGTVTVAAWNSTTSQPAFHFGFDLSGVTGLNDDPNAIFRLVDETIAGTAGTATVDNVIVSGNPLPEPATLSLLTVASAATMFR